MKVASVLLQPKDRGLASGLVNCGTRAGLALGAPLIAWLVVSTGWLDRNLLGLFLGHIGFSYFWYLLSPGCPTTSSSPAI